MEIYQQVNRTENPNWMIDYGLWTPDLWIPDHELLNMDYWLWITDYGLLPMDYSLWITDFGVLTMHYSN